MGQGKRQKELDIPKKIYELPFFILQSKINDSKGHVFLRLPWQLDASSKLDAQSPKYITFLGIFTSLIVLVC